MWENRSFLLGNANPLVGRLKTEVLPEPALVGRKRELEELQHYLELAIEGKGTTVFVSGEAGSGKTRLVNEFLNSARQKKELTALSGWCLSNVGIPYFPFVEAFSAYFSTSETARQLGNEGLELNYWLKGPAKAGLSGTLEHLSPQAWKDQTFAAVTKALLNISANKPTILFIDDAHWADSASLALLHYISRSIASRRVLILATFRSEELNPDSEGRPHPLVETLRLMGRENLFKEVKLPSLNQNDVSLLAENMVGGRVQSELAKKLASESQGNPLFVVESLRMLSEKGDLVLENNRWRLAIDEIGIPTKIKDIILRRVEALKPNQRKILDLASVMGSKFNPELLGAVLGQDSLEVLETLSAIAKSTSMVVCEGSFYKFDHTKCRDALYEEISPPLRKAYHGRVAERLESGWKGVKKMPVSDLAYHYAQAGNKEKAVKYALAAGEDALALFCGAEVVKHFKYVLDVTSGDTAYVNERTTALEGFGDGLFALGRCGEAVKAFEQLSSTASSGLVKLRALRKAMKVSTIRGDYSHALEMANKAVEDPRLDRLECARVRLYKGMIKNWGGKSNEAIQDMEESRRVFEGEYSLPDMIDMLGEIGTAYKGIGQLENALAAELRSCALGECARNLNREHYVRIYLCYVFNSCGLQKEALGVVAECFKINEKVSDPIGRAWNQIFAYWMSGLLLEAKAADRLFSGLPLESMRDFGTGAKIKFFMSSLISGALRKFKQGLKAAVAQSLKGAEYAEETDSYQAKANIYANLTRQYAELGDMEQAEKYHKKLVKIFDESSLAGFLWAYALFSFSEAIFFSSKGQWKEANQLYEEALETYRKMGPPNALDAAVRRSYCWALLQQGRFANAKAQFEEAKKTLTSFEKQFTRSNIQGYLIAPMRVERGKEFNMRLDLVNVAKNAGMLVRVEDLAPADFKVTDMQPRFDVQQGSVDMEKKVISPFWDEVITFTVQAMKEGTFDLNPRIVYVDDLGETKTCKPKPVSITVQPAQPEFEVIPGRVSSGFADLDRVLLGGIPEKYAVALAAPSCDERQLLIRRFLEAGAGAGETTLYITCEASNAKDLAQQFQSNFSLLICNPQADTSVETAPNVFKLKGIENLTNIDIALTKFFRTLDPSNAGPKRACIDLISDVLLRHHVVITREWLTSLLLNLKSKGFTTLAVVDPGMHPAEEFQAILGLFEGEVNMREAETDQGLARFLKVKRMSGQKYLKEETRLTEE